VRLGRRGVGAALAAAGGAVAGLVLAAAPASAASGVAWAATGESIPSYQAAVTVDPDGTMHVKETIRYTFAGGDHHGIDRYLVDQLPIDGDDAHVRAYPISDESASSPTGANAHVDVTQEGARERIRIGSASETVSGTQTYVISYTVKGAFNRFTSPQTDASGTTTPAHDELYWNITGDEWTVPIQSATVTVTAPKPAADARCYRGVRGSTDTCSATTGPPSRFTTTSLVPGQGMSILLAYPVGTVSDVAPILEDAPKSGLAQLTQVSPYSVGGSAALLALIVGAMVALVRRRGRDSAYTGLTPGLMPVHGEQPGEAFVTRHPSDVAVQFTPPAGLRPGQIGTLIDEVANPVDVTATIIDLAVRGYLRIEEVTNEQGTKVEDWRLVVVLPPPSGDELLPYEMSLMKALFKGRDQVELKGELRNTFASDLHATQYLLYDEVTRRGWFRGNPDSVRKGYRMLGIALAAVGFVCAWFGGLAHIDFLPPAAAVFLGGLFVLREAHRMPARTAAGSAVLTQAQGFRRYLETAEAGQIRFEEGQDVFSRYLPYAIIFGVADRWARIFDELARSGAAVARPSWYVGYMPAWSYLALGSSMSSFETSSNSSLVSTPASSGSSGFSSGGGFSGGGGGGGGGGSW